MIVFSIVGRNWPSSVSQWSPYSRACRRRRATVPFCLLACFCAITCPHRRRRRTRRRLNSPVSPRSRRRRHRRFCIVTTTTHYALRRRRPLRVRFRVRVAAARVAAEIPARAASAKVRLDVLLRRCRGVVVAAPTSASATRPGFHLGLRLRI